jgi:EamA domain-containing membrane protein RarD
MLVVSIILEAAVAVIAILAARKRSPYFYGLAFTFGVYVAYDLARKMQINVQEGLLSALFLLASLSALVAVWGLYRKL